MACPKCKKGWRKIEYIEGKPYLVCSCGYREEAHIPRIISPLKKRPKK